MIDQLYRVSRDCKFASTPPRCNEHSIDRLIGDDDAPSRSRRGDRRMKSTACPRSPVSSDIPVDAVRAHIDPCELTHTRTYGSDIRYAARESYLTPSLMPRADAHAPAHVRRTRTGRGTGDNRAQDDWQLPVGHVTGLHRGTTRRNAHGAAAEEDDIRCTRSLSVPARYCLVGDSRLADELIMHADARRSSAAVR